MTLLGSKPHSSFPNIRSAVLAKFRMAEEERSLRVSPIVELLQPWLLSISGWLVLLRHSSLGWLGSTEPATAGCLSRCSRDRRFQCTIGPCARLSLSVRTHRRTCTLAHKHTRKLAPRVWKVLDSAGTPFLTAGSILEVSKIVSFILIF